MTDRSDFRKSSAHHRLLGPGPRHIGSKVRRVTNPLFKSRGLAQGDIVFRWSEIVGPDLAAFCYPMKLAGARGAHGGTLTVRVAGAAALEFEFLVPQVIERINTYYGYQAITHVQIEQGPLPRKERKCERPMRRLSSSDEKALEVSLESVKNPELRNRLEELGRLIKTSQRR